MKIALTSDTHGYLPQISPSGVDGLIIAGDIMHTGYMNLMSEVHFLQHDFFPWCEKFEKPILLVPGNHDFSFDLFPQVVNSLPNYPSNLTWVNLGMTKFLRFNIFCMSYTLPFCDWAFQASEQKLGHMLQMVSDTTDMIVSHGPPYGLTDGQGKKLLGSVKLRECINRHKIPLVVCGHIHNFGIKPHYCGQVANVAYTKIDDNTYNSIGKYMVYDSNTQALEIVEE